MKLFYDSLPMCGVAKEVAENVIGVALTDPLPPLRVIPSTYISEVDLLNYSYMNCVTFYFNSLCLCWTLGLG